MKMMNEEKKTRKKNSNSAHSKQASKQIRSTARKENFARPLLSAFITQLFKMLTSRTACIGAIVTCYFAHRMRQFKPADETPLHSGRVWHLWFFVVSAAAAVAAAVAVVVDFSLLLLLFG